MPQALIIPYGLDRKPPGPLRAATASFPSAIVHPGTSETLRLNTAVYHASGQWEQTGGSDPFDVVHRHVLELCGSWANEARRFVDWYFAAVTRIIEMNRPALEQRLAPFDGLYRVEDWRYSAPLPLARAFLPMSAQAADHAAADDYTVVEFAFFIAGKLLAVESGASNLLPRHAALRASRLSQAGIDRIVYQKYDIEPGNLDLFTRILRSAGRDTNFWSAQALPSGPFRPDPTLPS